MATKITIEATICKGCELCVVTCPKKIVQIDRSKFNAKGYNPAVCTDTGKCTACGMCAIICPDSAITVEK